MPETLTREQTTSGEDELQYHSADSSQSSDPCRPGEHDLLAFNQVVEDPDDLLQCYAKRYAYIDESYIKRGVAGVALVAQEKRGRYFPRKYVRLDLKTWVRGDRIEKDPELIRLIFSALDLKYKISMFDRQMNANRSVGLRRLYALFAFSISTLFAKSSGRVKNADAFQDFKATLRKEIKSIEEFYERSVDKALEGRYSSGLFAGFALVAALTTIMAIFVPGALQRIFDVSVRGPSFQALLITMLAGSLGAVLSVMIRMSRQRLTLRSDVDPSRLFILGMFRPAVGSLFGIAIYVLILAGLLPLSREPQTELALAAALGFLAGFSERWAQDVVTSAADGVANASATQIQ